MTELRAPDPTLSVLWCRSAGSYVLVAATATRSAPVAHAPHRDRFPDATTGRTACGYALTSVQSVRAQHARWYATACPVCFPDAPPPGHETCRADGHPGCEADCSVAGCPGYEPSPFLDWQLTSDLSARAVPSGGVSCPGGQTPARAETACRDVPVAGHACTRSSDPTVPPSRALGSAPGVSRVEAATA